MNKVGTSPITNSLVSAFIEKTSLSIKLFSFNFPIKLKSIPCSCLYPKPNLPWAKSLKLYSNSSTNTKPKCSREISPTFTES